MTDLQAMARVWRDGQKQHCHGPHTECETHNLLQCECWGSGVLEEEQSEVRSCQQGRQVVVSSKGVEELMGWRHFTAPMDDKVEDAFLVPPLSLCLTF